MDDLLNRNLFLVKEHTGIMKAANNYDMYDPDSGQIVLECREEGLSGFTKVLRFTRLKTNTPFDVRIRTTDGRQLVRVSRGWTFWRSHVQVHDHGDNLVGTFRQRLLSIGGKFDVHGPDDQVLCNLKGKWTGWDFRFVSGETEFARVTKKWAGIGKELFTTADNYMLSISDAVPADHPLRPLILAAVVSIDMVLKESSG